MTRLALFFPLAALAGPAVAADRTIGLSSFDRVRVDGPFEVRIATGRPAGAVVSGDPRAIERVQVRVDGATAVVRRDVDGWGEQPRRAVSTPTVVTLSTPTLVSATSIAGARLAITRTKGDRVDLAVTGAGAIAVQAADAAVLNVTVIGAGTVAVSGHAARVRLLTNGPGTIDAGALSADDLVVRLDGSGETRARARYTATVTNAGLGRIDVAGSPRCTIRAVAGGPVRCGAPFAEK